MHYQLLLVTALLSASVSGQYLVLIGGNLADGNANVWNRMVTLAGGKGVAKIGVVSASRSTTPEGTKVVNNFVNTYGALSAVQIPVTALTANSRNKASLVEEQTGIFIVEDSGVTQRISLMERFNAFLNNKTVTTSAPDGVVCYEGANQDRLRLVNVLRPLGVDSRVLTAIKTVLNNGGMVAGNSAIMGSSVMVLKGDSLGALTFGTRFFHWPQAARIPLSFSLRGGLGLLSGYVLDSQISELGREGRLLRLTQIAKNVPFIGTSKGLGVGENTALVVANPSSQPVGTVVTATGAESGVFLVNGSGISVVSVQRGVYDNVPFSFLTVNDTIDLTSNAITFASFKTSLTGQEYFETVDASADILSDNQKNQWRIVPRYLIDSKPTSVTSYSVPGFSRNNIPVFIPRVRVIFDRTSASGYGSDISTSSGGLVYVPSYYNMLASIKVFGALTNPTK